MKWRDEIIVLVVGFGSIGGQILALNNDWDKGIWVHMPIPTDVFPFSPAIIDLLITIVCLSLGIMRRSSAFKTIGYTSLAISVLLFLFTGFLYLMKDVF